MSEPADEGKSIGGRAHLVAKLQERGLSRRHAVRVLNLIFTEMQRALKRGRSVEFPLGKLERVRRFVQTDRPGDRPRYTVEWQLDEADYRELDSWTEPQKTPKRGSVEW